MTIEKRRDYINKKIQEIDEKLKNISLSEQEKQILLEDLAECEAECEDLLDEEIELEQKIY